MQKLQAGIVVLFCTAVIAGCSGGSPFSTNNQVGNPIFSSSNAKLQLAVGTLDDAAGTWTSLDGDGTTPAVYLNAVSTFRQTNGNTAFTNTGDAKLTGPAGFASFVDGTTIVDLGALSSYGQLPGTNAVTGLPPTYPSVGAPAAGFSTGFLAQSSVNPLGNPAPGSYSVNVNILQNGVTTPYSATATLPASPTVLGPWGTPPVFVADVSHDGGGTFTLPVRPVGVTETLILVFNTCGAPPVPGPEVASVETTSGTATLPPGTLAPLCSDGVTTATYSAVALGADYPLVESGPPASTSQTPTITGSGGTADLTFSAFSANFSP